MNRITRYLLFLVIIIGIGHIAFLPAPVSADDNSVEIIEPFSSLISGVVETLGGDTPDYTGCTRIDTLPVNSYFEQQVVELVNIERAKVGAAPLKRNSELDFAARYHSRDMVDDSYVYHETRDRVDVNTTIYVCSPGERITQYYSGYSAIGENIAAGYDTPEQVVAAWMSSTGHRANILNPDFREVGMGYYDGTTSYREYWTLDFGTKPGVYPVIINQEAALTNSPNVNLYIYGKGVWGEMRIKNDAEPWSGWLPFQENISWQIPPLNGTHILSVELRKTGSITTGAASSDTITLTGYLPPNYDNLVYLPLITR